MHKDDPENAITKGINTMVDEFNKDANSYNSALQKVTAEGVNSAGMKPVSLISTENGLQLEEMIKIETHKGKILESIKVEDKYSGDLNKRTEIKDARDADIRQNETTRIAQKLNNRGARGEGNAIVPPLETGDRANQTLSDLINAYENYGEKGFNTGNSIVSSNNRSYDNTALKAIFGDAFDVNKPENYRMRVEGSGAASKIVLINNEDSREISSKTLQNAKDNIAQSYFGAGGKEIINVSPFVYRPSTNVQNTNSGTSSSTGSKNSNSTSKRVDEFGVPY